MEKIKRIKERKRGKINEKGERNTGNPSQQEELNGFNMETRQMEMGRQEGRTTPEAKPPGKGADEGRGNMEETVTLCYSHSKEGKQDNRTGQEPKERVKRPTTQGRGRKITSKSHGYLRRRKEEQEKGKGPGAAKNSKGTPTAPNKKKKNTQRKAKKEQEKATRAKEQAKRRTYIGKGSRQKDITGKGSHRSTRKRKPRTDQEKRKKQEPKENGNKPKQKHMRMKRRAKSA